MQVIAGVDEVGRGSLMGPVFAAAVILDKKINKKLLKDSKTLNKNEREKIAKYIWKGDIENDDEAEKILTNKRKLEERNFAKKNKDKFEQFNITREGSSIFVKYEEAMENFSLLEKFEGERNKQIRLEDGTRRDWDAVRRGN